MAMLRFPPNQQKRFREYMHSDGTLDVVRDLCRHCFDFCYLHCNCRELFHCMYEDEKACNQTCMLQWLHASASIACLLRIAGCMASSHNIQSFEQSVMDHAFMHGKLPLSKVFPIVPSHCGNAQPLSITGMRYLMCLCEGASHP